MTKYAITFTLNCGLEKIIVDECKICNSGYIWTKTDDKIIFYPKDNIVSIELIKD